MKYEMTKQKSRAISRLFDDLFRHPDKYPDKGVILSLDEKEMTKVFTKKRIELIKIIKSKKIKSMTELAKSTKRELSAIERDLKLLERFSIVKLKKKGKIVTPVIDAEIIVLPLGTEKIIPEISVSGI